jgi:hypothetical protein
MAITNKDNAIKVRVMSLAKQLKLEKKSDKEIIYAIAGICGISHRTASEHFHAWKAQETLSELGFNEECQHDWSNAFATSDGLTKECRLCHKTEDIKLK